MGRAEPSDVAMVQAEVRTWQVAHPEATLAEIEQEVDRRLGALRAAMSSAVAEAEEPTARPTCPACGVWMHRDRKRTIRQGTAHGGTVEVTGQAWRCPVRGAGVFPPG